MGSGTVVVVAMLVVVVVVVVVVEVVVVEDVVLVEVEAGAVADVASVDPALHPTTRSEITTARRTFHSF